MLGGAIRRLGRSQLPNIGFRSIDFRSLTIDVGQKIYLPDLLSSDEKLNH